MATVTHIIRSEYDPADREKLERETGQRTDDHSDPWQTESSSAQHRIRAAPAFVPATISYDEWGAPSHTTSPIPVRAHPESNQPRSSTAEWYRSLTAGSSPARAPAPAPAPPPPPPPRPSSAPSPPSHDARPPPETPATHDWFIRKALLRSAPCTQPSSPAPSLADLLVRDPPPMPSEARFVPPAWVHVGPSNRGFGMLQRGGWSEGEGLGAHVVRRAARANDAGEYASSVAEVDAAQDVPVPEVIDLALSDSEASEEAYEEHDVVLDSAPAQASASHMQRSLLTPLPTILKSDRLGIGMKAKTEGPYRQSKKRVTHNAAALAAHIRSAEEMRRNKSAFGKGKRGFAKIHKREMEKRKAMLAYLNE